MYTLYDTMIIGAVEVQWFFMGEKRSVTDFNVEYLPINNIIYISMYFIEQN